MRKRQRKWTGACWGRAGLGVVLVAMSVAASFAQIPQIVKLTPADENVHAALKEDPQPDTSACHVPMDRRLTAEVHAKVMIDGHPEKVTLAHGSGDKCLDDAAVLAVENSSFFPAEKGQKIVADDVVMFVDFGGLTADEVKASNVPVTHPRVVRQTQASFGDCKVKRDSEYHALVGLIVDVHGIPTQVKISKSTGDACLDEQAKRSARGYLFAPALEDGKPVPVRMSVEMQYNN